MAIKIAQIKKFEITFTGLKHKEENKESGISVQIIPTLEVTLKFNNSIYNTYYFNKVLPVLNDGTNLSNDWVMKIIYNFLDKTDSVYTDELINKYIKVDSSLSSNIIEKISHVLEEDWIELQ